MREAPVDVSKNEYTDPNFDPNWRTNRKDNTSGKNLKLHFYIYDYNYYHLFVCLFVVNSLFLYFFLSDNTSIKLCTYTCTH